MSFRRAVAVLSLTAVTCAPGQDASAGAWTKPKGVGEVIVSGLYAEALEGFDRDGDPQAVPVFRKAELQAYVEYGVTDWLTAIGRTQGKTDAVGDLSLVDEARFGLTGFGARARIWHGGGSVLSAEATGRLATGGGARTEDGDLDLRLLAGHGFEIGRWSAFVDAQVAYRLRFGHSSDEIRADMAFGIRPQLRLLLMAQSFSALSVGGKPGERGETSEHKIQLSGVYDVAPGLSVQLGVIATVAGRGALRENGLITAVWYRF